MFKFYVYNKYSVNASYYFSSASFFFSAGAASIWNDIIKIQLDNDCEGIELSTTDMLDKC